MRIGQGWDVHRMVPGRALMLGGIQIPSEKGEDGHSDGDVLLHALIDALLGVDAKGYRFPLPSLRHEMEGCGL